MQTTRRLLGGTLVRPKSLTETVLDELRARIVSGAFESGMALSENALAAELGISKTPVREALLRLKVEGLVDIQPQRGSFVFRLDAAQVTDITELRDTLEAQALQMAMERDAAALARALERPFRQMQKAHRSGDLEAYPAADGAFHVCIIEQSGNPFFSAAYGLISFRVQALRGRLVRESVLNDNSMREHEQIMEAVGAGDRAAAKRLLRQHILQARQTYLNVLAGDPPLHPGGRYRRAVKPDGAD